MTATVGMADVGDPQLPLELQMPIKRLTFKSDPDEDRCIMPAGKALLRR